jgi:hypothetical protein
MLEPRPTRADATTWALEKKELKGDIEHLQRLVRSQMREAWNTFRDVFPEAAHPVPWLSAGESEISKVDRDLLTKLIAAMELEFHDDGRVACIAYPPALRELAKQAHDHLKETE